MKKIITLILMFSFVLSMGIIPAYGETSLINIFDKTTISVGWVNTTASDTTDNNFRTSDYIPVNSNDVITFAPANSGQGWHLVTYDVYGNPISIGDLTSGVTISASIDSTYSIMSYTIPSGIAYFRIIPETQNVEKFLVTKNQPFSLIDYNAFFSNGGNSGVNSLVGKSALFVGDSICYGQWDNEPRQGWAGRIATQYGMNVTNISIGGASFSTVRERRIVTQLHETQGNSYDYVILQGGTNDGWGDMAPTGTTPAPVGVMTNSFNVADFDINTFAGGLEEAFYYAYKYFPTARIGFITTFATPLGGEQGLGSTGDMCAYYDLALEICEKWGVQVLDMYHDRYVNNQLMQVTTYNCLQDALHPNANGYDNLAPYIGEWMTRLVDNATYKANPFINKRAIFVGDSISYGHYDEPQGYSWAGRLADSLGILSDNQSKSGWSLSTVRGSQIVSQLQANKDKQYDYVIMEGGVNDAWGVIDPPGSNPAPVGVMTDSYGPKDFDTTTFAGALEHLFYNAYQLFPNARLGYLITFALPASTFDMKNYHDVAIDICNKWKVSCYDMYTDQNLARDLDAGNLTNMIDTVHPNKSGYDIITPYIEEWFKTIEYADISSFEAKMPAMGDKNALPYTKNGMLYVNDCDSTNGWSGDFGTNVSLCIDSKTQGMGAISLSGGNNQKLNDIQYIGGMAYLDFTQTVNLSGYDTLAFDFYISKDMTNKYGQLQLNFATTGADGYNTLVDISNLSAGWHSISFSTNLDAFKATAYDWSQINKLRFTWWNIYNSIPDGMTVMIDNIRMFNQAELEARNIAVNKVIDAIESIGDVLATNFKAKLDLIVNAENMVDELKATYGDDVSSEVTNMVTLVRAREQYNHFSTLTPATIVYGDIDNSGDVTAEDALLALQHSVEKITITDDAFTRGDVDGNNTIDVTDSLLILHKSVDKIDKFPVEE